MGLFGPKKFCPVCGNKASRFLPLKLEGEPLCGECESKVMELPEDMRGGVLENMAALREYFTVFDENQALRERFQQTYQHDFGILGGSLCLDTTNRLLRLSTSDNSFVFEPENIKLFRISEDSAPLFEGTKDELVCYQSTAPDRARNMGREVDRFRIERRQREQMRHLEEEMERRAKERGETYSSRYMDEGSDQMMFLGTDNDLEADWDNGVFYDNFRGVWGAIDGHIVYMELSFEGDDYNLYSVPILLDGEEYNLQVAYDFSSGEWSILGAAPGLDASGMAAKELRLLAEGDVITTIWQLASFSGDDDFEMYAAEELTVTADTAFGETALPDGQYGMVFEMWDAAGNSAYSDAVLFDCLNGEITTTVVTD